MGQPFLHIDHYLIGLSKLEELSLEDNLLTGKIPQTIGVLTPLKILNLGNNNLNGSLPPEGNTVNIYLHLVFHLYAQSWPIY